MGVGENWEMGDGEYEMGGMGMRVRNMGLGKGSVRIRWGR
jgi:hypothetical protein